MSIGKRNRLVDVERRKTGNDAANHPNKGWELHKKKWCEYKAPTGMGSIRSAASNTNGITGTQVLYSLRTSYDKTITEAMRVNDHGTIYEIKQVVSDEATRQYTDIVVIQGGGNG